MAARLRSARELQAHRQSRGRGVRRIIGELSRGRLTTRRARQVVSLTRIVSGSRQSSIGDSSSRRSTNSRFRCYPVFSLAQDRLDRGSCSVSSPRTHSALSSSERRSRQVLCAWQEVRLAPTRRIALNRNNVLKLVRLAGREFCTCFAIITASASAQSTNLLPITVVAQAADRLTTR